LELGWTVYAEVVEEETDAPYHTGNKNNNDRSIMKISLYSPLHGESYYELSADEQMLDYTDKINCEEPVELKAAPGETVEVTAQGNGEWVHYYVFIDFEGDMFKAGIAEDGFTPTGDLVAYSFYNNNSSSDEAGYNSIGTAITGNNRNKPAIPAFTVPAEEGKYRMRIKHDWCNIDPRGDNDGKFGDFKQNRGQIVDVVLVVTNETGVIDIETENGVETIYDLTGRKIETITNAGIYIVNGKKVLVK
jgi:hypothetical protein